jgi:hypothetical protein
MNTTFKFSSDERALAQRWIDALKHTRSNYHDRATMFIVAAAPNSYVPLYRLQWWQAAAFPLLYRRLKALQAQICVQTEILEPKLMSADTALRKIEFADKVASPLHCLNLRSKVLSHNFSPWAVRQAFNSAALAKKGPVLALRPQPVWMYVVATSMMWAAIAALLFMFAATFLDALDPKLSPQNLGWLFIGMNVCIALAGIGFVLGPQWKLGQQVIEKLIHAGD